MTFKSVNATNCFLTPYFDLFGSDILILSKNGCLKMMCIQWDSNLGCQDIFFNEISEILFYKITFCLYPKNQTQVTQRSFFSEFQRGFYGIGGINEP